MFQIGPKMQTVTSIETGTINDLLDTVLMPNFPKKLENAFGFISNSKQSANETKERKLVDNGTKKQTNSTERRVLLKLEDMATEANDSSYNHHMDMVPHSFFSLV